MGIYDPGEMDATVGGVKGGGTCDGHFWFMPFALKTGCGSGTLTDFSI